MNDRFLVNPRQRGELLAGDHYAGLPELSQQSEIAPEGFDPKRVVSMIYRWRYLFAGILFLTLVCAGLWASLQTPLYRATATLELNPAPTRVVQTEERDEVTQSDRDFLSLQVGLIKSRSVAERVARALELGRDEMFLGEQPESADQARAQAVNKLMNNFAATGTASDRIMQLSFVHADPAVAARVANGYAEQAIESNFERAHAATARSRQFLNRRLEETRRDLERSERELIAYARQANIVNVVSAEGATSGDSAGGTLIASNLVALNQQLADAQNARIVAQQRYAQGSASAAAATESSSTVQALQQQKAQLQAQYEEKLQELLPEHPEMLAMKARLNGLDRQIRMSGGRTSSAVQGSLRAEMIAAQNRERELQGRINQLQGRLLDLNDRGVQYTILKRSVEANRSLYNGLLAQLGSENSSATRTSGIAVVDAATAPGAPFSPNIPRTLILALLGGCVLGYAGVFAADRMYDTINNPDDIKNLLRLPVLGVIPVAGKNQHLDELIADPQSPVAEAYHSTRASLQFVNAGGPPRTILFTSPGPGEGKTSSTIAIAGDFVAVGKRVVVIDADLRKPSLRGDSPGLSSVLAGAAPLHEALLHTEVTGLSLLPAGRIPPNPTALLTGRAFVDVVQALENDYDVVIIDGPPVMGLADAPLLSSVAEATVMILASGQTRRAAAEISMVRLRATGGNVVGAILNKFDRKGQGYSFDGGYGYNYSYGAKSRKRALIGLRTVDGEEQCAA